MNVKLSVVPNVQKASVPFPVAVFVKNAVAGASITVTLSEEGGPFRASQSVSADAHGFAVAPFTVVLTTVGRVHLSTDADDAANGAFDTSADSVQVVP
jgi:hypothetical protein